MQLITSRLVALGAMVQFSTPLGSCSSHSPVVRALLAHGALVELTNACSLTPSTAAAGIRTRIGGGVLGLCSLAITCWVSASNPRS